MSGSTMVVGSSYKIASGCDESALAIATDRFMPVERSEGSRFSMPATPTIFESLRKEHETMEKAIGLLEAGSAAFVAAIRAFPPDDIDQQLDFPFRPGETRSFNDIIFIAHWNMAYHEGQICYVQTLYGDTETH